MIQTDKESSFEKEQETSRIRGKDFEKWQKESAKIERNRARNAEIATEQDLEKKKEREKIWIWCKVECLKVNIDNSNNDNNK